MRSYVAFAALAGATLAHADTQKPKVSIPDRVRAELPEGQWHTAKHDEAKQPIDFGPRIETIEGRWRSTWIRRPNTTNTYDAVWTSSHYPTFKGTVVIEDDVETMVVYRLDADGNTCVYRAALDSVSSAWTGGARIVNGTSSCTNTGHKMVYPWSARFLKQ
jgi:hypothetical protein